MFLHEEFHQSETNFSHFTYIPTLTQEKWKGAMGRVYGHLPSDVKNKTFYICGFKDLVLETKEFLMRKGVKPEYVKSERYS